MTKTSLRTSLLLLIAATFLVGPQALPQSPILEPDPQQPIARMISPELDHSGEPFSYPSQSTDQLAMMGGEFGAELTPQDTIYTGFGELLFYVGIERRPVDARIRTLAEGDLPIFRYVVVRDGLEYHFTVFTASLSPHRLGGDLTHFVRVEVRNLGSTKHRGYLTTAWRFQGPRTTLYPSGDNRFERPLVAPRLGAKEQQGGVFNPHSVYSVDGHAFLRDGRAVYFFPATPQPQLTASLNDYYNRHSSLASGSAVEPDTPMAVAEYSFDVLPGEQRLLEFSVPERPVSITEPAYETYATADLNRSLTETTAFWRKTLMRGLQIITPEEKVNDTYRASLAYDLEALRFDGSKWVQTINLLQYHGFYLRDSADFVRMYDTSGLMDVGGHVVDFFGDRQQADGNFLSQPGQYDGWGEALWTYGEHYRMTHSLAFAEAVYPRVQRAVDWLEGALARDPLHLVPATDVRDNEYIAGHLTGYNFLALDGLNAAELLAHDLHHPLDEQRYRRIEAALRNHLMDRLDKVTAKTGGYIPPALDGDLGGTDWGNLLSLTPEQQLNPFDPRVTATLRETQSHYQEGLMTYRQPDQGTYLHHYLTIKNTLTELIRGEQPQVVREFYAELMHTSSTNAGWEYSIRPWGDRNFEGNLSPHGWFAAEFRNLLRNMMVREEGDELHLLSTVTPEWIGADKALTVQHAATYFGEISFTLSMPSDSDAILDIKPGFDAGHEPKQILVHTPFFEHTIAVSIDGKPTAISNSGTLTLTPKAHRIEWLWTRIALPEDVPNSYADAVKRYVAEYRRIYDLRTGVGKRPPQP